MEELRNIQLVLPCTNARNCDRRRCRNWHEDDTPERKKEIEEIMIREVRKVRGGKYGAMGRAVNRRKGSVVKNRIIKSKPETSHGKYEVTGLSNTRNTCYLNTILQSLASCRVFTERLMGEAAEKSHEGTLTHELAHTIEALQNGEYKTMEPTELKEKIGEIAKEFCNNRQHDAHELLTKILDQVHEETKDNSNESFVKKTFFGTTISTIQCKKCKGDSKKPEEYNSLSLSIPDKENITLEECLALMGKEETVDWKCEYCWGNKASKTLEIDEYPETLVIQLKRFNKGTNHKNRRLVTIPRILAGMKIVAVVDHYGTAEAGHYRAKCWNEIMGKWYLLDDRYVKEIAEERIQSENAYVLIYSKQETQIVGNEETEKAEVEEPKSDDRTKRCSKKTVKFDEYQKEKDGKNARKRNINGEGNCSQQRQNENDAPECAEENEPVKEIIDESPSQAEKEVTDSRRDDEKKRAEEPDGEKLNEEIEDTNTSSEDDEEIDPNCRACGSFTHDGVLCATCKRWYHYQCIPEKKNEIKKMKKGYQCQVHAVKPANISPDPTSVDLTKMDTVEPNIETTTRSKEGKQEKGEMPPADKSMTELKTKLTKAKEDHNEITKQLKNAEKQSKKAEKEHEKAKSRVAELEKLLTEARAVIDEKNEMINNITGEKLEKNEECKRWELKVQLLNKAKAIEGQSANMNENNETNSTTDGEEHQRWVDEMGKMELKIDKVTSKLKAAEKENTLFKKDGEALEEKLKQLLIETNKLKVDKLALQEENRGLKEINMMLEMEMETDMEQPKHDEHEEAEEVEIDVPTPQETITCAETSSEPGEQKKDGSKMNEERRQKEDEGTQRKSYVKENCRNGASCYYQKKGICWYKHKDPLEKDNTSEYQKQPVVNETSKNRRKGKSQHDEARKPSRYEESYVGRKTEYEQEKKDDQRRDKPTERCKLGTACKYQKKGWCWFAHPEEDTQKHSNNKDPRSPTNINKERKHDRNERQAKEQWKKKRPADRCENGASCKYHKKGWCWFMHPEDKTKQPTNETKDGKVDHFLLEAVAQAACAAIQQFQKNLRPRGI